MRVGSSKQDRAPVLLDPISHDSHIYNHVQELLLLYPAARVDRLLEECGLQLAHGSVCRRDGGAITGMDCQIYLKAVRRIISYVDSVLGRISLLQAGCAAQVSNSQRAAQVMR